MYLSVVNSQPSGSVPCYAPSAVSSCPQRDTFHEMRATKKMEQRIGCVLACKDR